MGLSSGQAQILVAPVPLPKIQMRPVLERFNVMLDAHREPAQLFLRPLLAGVIEAAQID